MTETRQRFIREPNCNDVLLGRGFFCREHSGTKKFHQMCREHKTEYCSTNKQETKNIVAYRIINAVIDLDPSGRFLKLIPREELTRKGLAVDDPQRVGLWQEVDSDTVLKKTKQSLRDTSQSVMNSTSTEQKLRESDMDDTCFVESETSVELARSNTDEAHDRNKGKTSGKPCDTREFSSDELIAAEQLYSLLLPTTASSVGDQASIVCHDG